MIDYTVARQVLEDLISGYTGAPIIFENTESKVSNVEHIEMTGNNDAEPDLMELGGDVWRLTDIFTLAIFTEVGVGTERAQKIAAELTTLIRSSDSDNVAFGACIFTSVGKVDGKHLYQHNLTVVYYYFYGQQD